MSIRWITWAFEHDVGHPLTKLVMIKLADNANDAGECWPSLEYIAHHTEMSRRAVFDHIKRLVAQGVIAIRHRSTHKGRTSNLYKFTGAWAEPIRRGMGRRKAANSARGALRIVHGAHPNLSDRTTLAGKRDSGTLSTRETLSGEGQPTVVPMKA